MFHCLESVLDRFCSFQIFGQTSIHTLRNELNLLNYPATFVKFEYALSSGNWLTLAKLMSNTDQAKMLRDIVVSKKAAAYVSGLPKQVAMTGKSILKPLNRVQQRAIFKTMMAEEFVLLKGNIFKESIFTEILVCEIFSFKFVAVLRKNEDKTFVNFFITRKYPLRGYILGVLTHTTTWDRHRGGDETLKLVLVYVVWLLLS